MSYKTNGHGFKPPSCNNNNILNIISTLIGCSFSVSGIKYKLQRDMVKANVNLLELHRPTVAE